MALNFLQRFRSHYNQKSNKKTKSSRSNSIKRNPSKSKSKSLLTSTSNNEKQISKKTSQRSLNQIPTQPILNSNFLENYSSLSTDPILPLSSLDSSLSFNSNPVTSKVVHTTSNTIKTTPSIPVIAKSPPSSFNTDHLRIHPSTSHLNNSPSTSDFSNLSIPNHSHHDSSSSELSSPTSPAATSVPSHDSTHSFKDSKNPKEETQSNVQSKDDQSSKDIEDFNPKTRPQATKSNSFWKRMSRSSTLIQIKKKSSNEGESNKKLDSISQQEVDQSEPTKPIESEEGTSELESEVKTNSHFNEVDINSPNSIPENSTSQTQNSNLTHLNPSNSNLTGVGTKNRNSFQKLPSTSTFTEIPTNKRSSRTLSNYSPFNSSPLSTQTNLNQDQMRFPRPSLRNTEKRSSYSSNRLSIIPDGTLTSSDDLMKLLRGPSPYPMEAQPQYFSNSAPNSRPVSRQSRLINEI
ncbi:hypothetical protein DFH28DRAFT_895890 [Melampsora americana]|nr:hypothetical protein DFH28DRAFT_895890 [Melampsora americana]